MNNRNKKVFYLQITIKELRIFIAWWHFQCYSHIWNKTYYGYIV